MKKERIVVLCICAVLLGTLYGQWIAWACYIAMPSTARVIRPVSFGFGFENVEQNGGIFTPKGSVAEFMSAGWPPLGYLFAEARLLKGKSEGMNACPRPPQVENRYFTMQTSRTGK